MARQRQGSSGFGGIIGLIMTLVVLYLVFQVFKLAAAAIWFLGPILLIVAFFLNRKVVTDFFKTIFTDFKTKPVMSLVKGLFSFFALPLVGGWLFTKAVVRNKAEAITKKAQPEYAEYEEVKETTAEVVEEDDDFLDITEIEQQLEDLTVKENKPPTSSRPTPKSKQAKPDPNKYDNLFD